MPSARDAFQVEVSGGTLIISPAGDVNSLNGDCLHEAAVMLTELIDGHESPMLVFDLVNVPSCSSLFMSLLLRCHKSVKGRGGEMVLCRASTMMQELLRLTRLDTVWAIYETRDQALDAVDG